MRRLLLFSGLLGSLFLTVLAIGGASSVDAQKASGAGDKYYLKIDGVEGEVVDGDHVGDIVVQSFSWNQTRSTDTSSRITVQPLHVVLPLEKAGVTLLKKFGGRERIARVTLTARDGTQDYAKWILGDVMMVRYQMEGTWGLGRPLVGVDLVFAKIDTEYRQKLSNGGYGAAIKGGWILQ